MEWNHSQAFDPLGLGFDDTLDSMGAYRLRSGADKEDHMYNPQTILLLQKAAREGSYETFKAYTALVDFADDEKAENARPELTALPENLDQYSTVFLGYPNWWADLPMPVYTFLESVDLSGKTIIPFCPHGGSGFSRTVRTIAELQPEAVVSEDGLTISRGEVAGAKDEITAWVRSFGF